MGDLIPLEPRSAKRLGETVYTERGLRLPGRPTQAKSLWLGITLAIVSITAFLITFFW